MKRMKLQVRLLGRITILLSLLVIVLSGFGQTHDTTATGVRLSIQGQPVIQPFELPDGVCVGDELVLPVPVVDWRGDSLGSGWLLGGVAITLPYVVQEGDFDKILEFWALNSCSNQEPPIVITGGTIIAPLGTVFVGEQFTITRGTATTISSGGVTYSWTVNGKALPGAGDTLNYETSVAGTYAFVRKVSATVDYRTSATATVSVTVAAIVPGGGCTDSDGNKYKTVIIGSQEWMAENLRAKSKCGVSWDNTDPKYGRLYNWEAAMNCATISGGVQGLCPAGWHLPSDAEWMQLENYLEPKFPGVGVGGVLKSTTGWRNQDVGSNGNGTDNVGFCGIPDGYCKPNGDKIHQGDYSYWWSYTGFSWRLTYNDTDLYSHYDNMTYGNSVRCVKD